MEMLFPWASSYSVFETHLGAQGLLQGCDHPFKKKENVAHLEKKKKKENRNQQVTENRQAGRHDITSVGENHSIYLMEALCVNQILVSQAQVKDIDVYDQEWKILPIWLIVFIIMSPGI